MARATMRTAKLAVLFTLLGVSYAMAQTSGADIGSEGQAPTPTAPGDREAARAAFERGLSLVRESRYAEAKAAFLEAYQAYPHYLVLYNVAQADVQLGNPESAITYLERFLREGADLLSSERRQQVSARMEELRKGLPAERSASQNDTPEGAALAGEPPGSGGHAPVPLEAPELSQQHSPQPNAAPLSPTSSTTSAVRESGARVTPFVSPAVAGPQPVPAVEPDKTWGIVLGASGIALLGVASGLYLWNDSRHDGWEQDRRALDALPDRDRALANNLDLWQQARANNELLESIERVDVLTIITAGVGALALGAGTWQVLANVAPTPAIVGSHPGLSWRSSW